MFVCVVVFGLFHGLLFLPVALGLVGSTDNMVEEEEEQNINEETIHSKL